MSYEYLIRPLEQDWIGGGTITFNGENLYEILKNGKSISCVSKRKLKRIKEKLGERIVDIEENRKMYDEFCEIMSNSIEVKTDISDIKINFGEELLKNLK